MAVNYTGAGGVPKGTIYAATFNDRLGVPKQGFHVSMYIPTSAGGLEFAERWEVLAQPGTYERCGPLLGVDGSGTATTPCEPVPESAPRHVDVDVDQATGAVYAFDGEDVTTGDDLVVEYSPNGNAEITRFGERAPGSSTVAETPEKLHSSEYPGGVAVNSAGWVYVFDEFRNIGKYHRLAVFEPETPIDFSHYVYAGEIAGGTNASEEEVLPTGPVSDAEGNIYVGGGQGEGSQLEVLEPEEPKEFPHSSPAACVFTFSVGGIAALTVDPETGEPYFYTSKNGKPGENLRGIHHLSSCENGQIHEIGRLPVQPEGETVWGLAFDPTRQVDPGHEAGTLYAGSPGRFAEGKRPAVLSLGYIFAPPGERRPPSVGSEAATKVTATSGRVTASIDPSGHQTQYAFQYLTEAEYEAKEPDERQSLSVGATGGIFGLSFGGSRLGGPAVVNLSSGSRQATALRTAVGTGSLHAASGTGDLNGAIGTGTLIKELNTITSASAAAGHFEVGQGISGEGIPLGASITGVQLEGTRLRLTISKSVTKSGIEVSITSGTATVTSLAVGEGAFEVGQTITGGSIPQGTTVSAVSAGTLTLSQPATRPETGASLKAGSTKINALSVSLGSFEVGQAIEGEGIPLTAKITEVNGTELTLSAPVSKPGNGVALSTPGPYPLAVGEVVEGPGVPIGTVITSVQAGRVTLSHPATASGSNLGIHAGLPFDATAGGLRRALEGLASVGERNVVVSGGPGDAFGSSPYEITFTRELGDRDVGSLEVDGSRLTGSGAVVAIEHQGGQGFAGAAEQQGVLNATGAQFVATTLTNLTPDTGYRLRVVARSNCNPQEAAEICEAVGQTLAIHTYAARSWSLPDSRTWELVSPSNKNNGQVLAAAPLISSCTFGDTCKPGQLQTHFPMQSSPDGNEIAYEGTSFNPQEGGAVENQYLGARDSASGWKTVSPTPATLQHVNTADGYTFVSEDLGIAVIKQEVRTLSASAPATYSNLYIQSLSNPADPAPVISVKPPNRIGGPHPNNSNAFEIIFSGASADGSRVFFAANDALTLPTAVAPAAEDGGGDKFNLYEWHEGHLALVNVAPDNAESRAGASFVPISAGAISTDGSHAFWENETGRVFVRIKGRETRRIEDPGHFVSASYGGEVVLLSDGCLYSLKSETCVDLTVSKGGFQGLVGQSRDLSSIYYVDSEVLTGEEEGAQGEVAAEGADNLYAWTQGAGIHFVSRLLNADNEGLSGGGGGGVSDWAAAPSERTAEASSSGRYLTFVSHARLTGYDNTGPCAENSGEGTYKASPCPEAFVYNSVNRTLICASCNPSGARPLGWAVLRRIEHGTRYRQPQYLTDSGRLYFDTEDSLSPFDTNEGAEDVYEWEPAGSQSCTRQEGCVNLLSSGREDGDSNFLAMDETGKDVFFTTRQRLVGADTDNLFDLYDAREGGGFAFESEIPPGSECSGEACQPPPPPAPQTPPASAGLPAPGNYVPPKSCPTGKIKKAGKCVPKMHKKSKRKKHTKRTKSKGAKQGGTRANLKGRAGR
jgi:hypothetical protein